MFFLYLEKTKLENLNQVSDKLVMNWDLVQKIGLRPPINRIRGQIKVNRTLRND